MLSSNPVASSVETKILLRVESRPLGCWEGGMMVGTLIGGRGDMGRDSYAGPAVVVNSPESFDFLLLMENIVERDEALIMTDSLLFSLSLSQWDDTQ